MAIDINIPSQVKNYANLAGFPVTGTLKTIFIAEDTNKTYRWTGSAYVEISPAGATGITIGTTAITSGTVGRVLFQGTGNVVQQAADFTFDVSTTKFQIGNLTPTGTTNPAVISLGATYGTNTVGQAGNVKLKIYDDNTNAGVYGIGLSVNLLELHSPNSFGFFTGSTTLRTERMRIFQNGNIGINTTTDAGFKLDVNGTARVSGNAQFGTGFFWDNTNGRLGIGTSSPAFKADIIGTGRINNLTIGDGTYRGTSITFVSQAGGAEKKGIFFDGGAKAYYQQTTNLLALESPYNGGALALSFDGNTNNVNFYNQSGTILSKIFAGTGNWGINTTTDAGFKLDVNGTARVDQTLQLNATTSGTAIAFGANIGRFTIDGSFIRFKAVNGGDMLNMTANFLGIFETSVVPSAVVSIASTTRGFLPPRMTTTQKNAIATPATGLMVYDTTLNRPCFYDGTTWITL